MFVLQKLSVCAGLFRSGTVQLAPPHPAPFNAPRITIADLRLATLGVVLDRLDRHRARSTLNHGGRP